jgi:hypothetical protein
LIFQESIPICQAFDKAREIVRGWFGGEEEKKFILLVEDQLQRGKINLIYSKGYNGDGAKNKKHVCRSLPFSMFKAGKCVDTYE